MDKEHIEKGVYREHKTEEWDKIGRKTSTRRDLGI